MKKSVSLFIRLFIVSIILLTYGCKKNGDPPEIRTVEVTEITNNSAISGGTIISDGGCKITEKGVCWNKTGNPTINDSKTSDGDGSGDFTSTITKLDPITTYYVRAYATNGLGIAYGEEVVFDTKFADIDGNFYNIIKIGSQLWMAENLKTTRFNDNTAIANVTNNAEWSGLTTPAYCWYNNDQDQNKPLYGAIYNWYAAADSRLCPDGWRVATDSDYNTMELSLGIPQSEIDTWGWRGTDQGTQLKNTTGWSSGENGTNTSGFTALPGGYRFYQTGVFAGQNIYGYWWTSSELDQTRGWYRRLDGDNQKVNKAATEKNAGKAVRCVKD